MKDGLVILCRLLEKKRYLICFDNGEEKELPLAVLKVEHMVASLPPDILIPTPQNAQEEAMLENAVDELIDAEETADLPEDSPDTEEIEERMAESAETEEQVVEE